MNGGRGVAPCNWNMSAALEQVPGSAAVSAGVSPCILSPWRRCHWDEDISVLAGDMLLQLWSRGRRASGRLLRR